jgi:hypothetical protein
MDGREGDAQQMPPLQIRYEPQTCASDCVVLDCHLSHGETWWVGDAPFFTRAAAEAALSEAAETERQLQAGIDTLAKS